MAAQCIVGEKSLAFAKRIAKCYVFTFHFQLFCETRGQRNDVRWMMADVRRLKG